MIEWIPEQEPAWLGQTSESITTAAGFQATQGDDNGMSTGDKMLLVSLFINALALAWSIYRWRQDND